MRNELYKFMDVELVLGNPKIECDGYGICKFVQKGVTTLTACEKERLIDGRIYFVERNCILLMNTDTIKSKNCVNHFEDDIFRMDTFIKLPNWITDLFDFSTVTLQLGSYEVKKNGHFYRVEIPFTENVMVELPPSVF